MSVSKSKHRFYIPPKNIYDDHALVYLPEYHHVVNVMRKQEGDGICFFDGKGNEFIGSIVSINKSDKVISVSIGKNISKTVKGKKIILVQSLIKGHKMDFVVEKATEMGATHIFPVVTEYSVVKLDHKKEGSKIVKWNRIMREASKQCGRAEFPILDRIWTLDEVFDALHTVDKKIICTIQDDSTGLDKVPDAECESLAVMIGPEGGFSVQEIKSAKNGGWTAVRVKNIVLRAETAGIAMLGVLCYKFGFWK